MAFLLVNNKTNETIGTVSILLKMHLETAVIGEGIMSLSHMVPYL